MQVNERFVEEGRIPAVLPHIGADVVVGDLGGLFHYLAQLAGQFEAAAQCVNAGGLDRQSRAAHAGPGQPSNHAFARHHLLGAEDRHAQSRFQVFRADLQLGSRVLEQLENRFAHQLAQLLLQLAHTGLTGIAFDNRTQCAVADAQARLGDTGLGQLLGPQVAFGDGQLLFGDVARQANHFHTVQQRARDRVQGVGGTHEQHLGQVQAQVQVVVEEVDVLLGVQGFQQRRGRVALIALPHLVDLVEHDHRVHHLDVFQGLHQLARLRADVSAAMTLDLGLVAHAADAESVEGSAQRFGDGLADAGLAHARWADQQHDRAADLALPGAHGEELEDAFFDVVQAGMVLIQHLARVLEVKLVGAVDTPGQGRRPIQVVPGHGIFRRSRLQNRQLAHFLIDALTRLLWQLLAVETLLELLQVGAAVVLGQPQFLLDHLELFLEEELALMLADLPVHLGRNLILQARDFDFLAQHGQHFFHALEHGYAIQDLLQFVAGG